MTLEELNELLKPEALDFLEEHKNESPETFTLKYSNLKNIPVRAVAEQLACQKKAISKLPNFLEKNFLYEKTALEQCSGEAAARYKLKLLEGEKILDMTGGLGIDAIYFSEKFQKVTYCEKNQMLAKIAQHNFGKLNISNVSIHNGGSVEWLQKNPRAGFDWIYLDPARRDENRRSVDLNYCQPNIYEIKNLLFERTDNILIKVSPAFDFSEAKVKFPELVEFIVVSVDSECKEVLLLLKKYKPSELEIKIKAVVLSSKIDTSSFSVQKKESGNKEKILAELISGYFYEPDAAIIKAGLTDVLASDLGLKFINKKIDYLVGDGQANEFPGRLFRINGCGEFRKEAFKKYLKQNKISCANISRRDFPLTAAEIKKMFKLKDGGGEYFFFTKWDDENKIFIHANKV